MVTGVAEENQRLNQGITQLEDRHVLWDLKKVGEVLGMGRSSIYTAMKSDGLPKPIKLGRSSKWRKSEILNWIDSRPQGLEHEFQ